MHAEGSAGTDGARRVGTPAAVLVVVASMVGTGVFTTTGLLLRDPGSPLAVLAAWMVVHAVREKPAAAWAGIATLLLAVGLHGLVDRRRIVGPTRRSP